MNQWRKLFCAIWLNIYATRLTKIFVKSDNEMKMDEKGNTFTAISVPGYCYFMPQPIQNEKIGTVDIIAKTFLKIVDRRTIDNSKKIVKGYYFTNVFSFCADTTDVGVRKMVTVSPNPNIELHQMLSLVEG